MAKSLNSQNPINLYLVQLFALCLSVIKPDTLRVYSISPSNSIYHPLLFACPFCFGYKLFFKLVKLMLGPTRRLYLSHHISSHEVTQHNTVGNGASSLWPWCNPFTFV